MDLPPIMALDEFASKQSPEIRAELILHSATAKQDFSALEKRKEEVEKAIKTRKVEGLTPKKLDALIHMFTIHCPKCGKSDSF